MEQTEKKKNDGRVQKHVNGTVHLVFCDGAVLEAVGAAGDSVVCTCIHE